MRIAKNADHRISVHQAMATAACPVPTDRSASMCPFLMRHDLATGLSHDTDVCTSIPRQGEAIGSYARVGGHAVIYISEDVDVSGKVSPVKRPELAP
jgi:hypothetical protein